MLLEITGKTLGDFNSEKTKAQGMNPRREEKDRAVTKDSRHREIVTVREQTPKPNRFM